MVMGRPLTPLELSASDRAQLESMAHSRSLPHGLVRRAEIVLLAAEGWPHEAVAGAVGVTRATVGKGRQRFLENGLNGLYDERRSGAPRSITDEQVAEVVYKTLKTKPKDQTQWSVRSMGAETGLTKDAVHRIWRSMVCSPTDTSPSSFPPILSWSTKYGISSAYTCIHPSTPWCCAWTRRVRSRRWNEVSRPWAWATWKGLRTPTSAPPVCRPGRGHRRRDDSVQASSSSPGVSPVPRPHRGQRARRSRRSSRRRPLRHPQACQGQAVAGTASPISRALHPHLFWFNIITRQAVRRDSFRTVRERIERIERYTAQWNANAPPFVWTATADSILAKIKRLCERISATKHYEGTLLMAV